MALPLRSNFEKVEQLNLFEVEKPNETSLIAANGSAFNDPAFAQNKTLPVHRWVPWIAGFSRDFVRDAIRRYLDDQGTILDPFAGVGTTLIEAILSGHHVIGFEINPYAALACRTKLGACLFDVHVLKSEIARFKAFCTEKTSSQDYAPISQPPQGFKTRAAFYSPSVLCKVLIIHDFIKTVEHRQLQDLFRLMFAATMITYSNYSYEPSLSQRVSSGKPVIVDFPVMETILSKLTQVVDDVKWLQKEISDKKMRKSVINDSFFNYSAHLEAQTVDLIITSPPYLNNYHYNRNTRPQLYWLGYAETPNDLKQLEEANFGKYWQSVRDLGYLGLAFSLPDTDIEERLQELRSLNTEKKAYGGNGWANYAAAYFNDCYTFAKGIDHVLKSGGTALVVIGNSILQGVAIPTDYYFGKIAESVGLELVDIHVPRATRIGNSIIQSTVRVAKAKASHQLYEAVVELRKK